MSVAFSSRIDGRYRQTPYRQHIQEQMGWNSDKAWEDSLRDVLALKELHDRTGKIRDLRLRQSLTLENFFYFPLPDVGTIYEPVEVHPFDDKEQTHEDLTALIRDLDSHRDLSSILLAARSGAGKTVAARKAFCDCFVTPSGSARPLLADYLPCWITVDATGTRDAEGNIRSRLIEHLILRACGLAENDVTRTPLTDAGLGRWLDQPRLKLLLFFDLNAWSAEAREDIAKDLCRFLDKYKTIGHRAVVAYRSSATTDSPLVTLTGDGRFQKYDLSGIPARSAGQYLERIRLFGNFIYQSIPDLAGGRHLFSDARTETQQVQKLVRLAATDKDGTSVISTPLLMHFCSLLKKDELAGVENLSDLYESVVRRHLERDRVILLEHRRGEKAEGRITTDLLADDSDLIRAAMTRLTALMVSQPEGSVTVSVADFRDAMTNPQTGKPRRGVGWWPAEESWHAAPWVQREFTDEATRLLEEFSLVRRDQGDKLRFLHDSMLYYFAGAGALRWCEKTAWPAKGRIPPDAWPAQAASQLRNWPGARGEVAEFLGGVLDEQSFEDLLLELMACPPDQGTARYVSSLIRGATSQSDVAKRLQSEYVRRTGWAGLTERKRTVNHILTLSLFWKDFGLPIREWRSEQWITEPLVFLSEIHAALLTEPDAACKSLADKLVTRMRLGGRPWLRTMFPRYRDNSASIRDRSSAVECVAVWVNPNDSQDVRIVSGCGDGTVELWNPETAETQTIITHEDCEELGVNCLAVLPDGRVVSGGWDKTVRLWDPQTGTTETIITHEDGVSCLAVFPDGRVVSGSRDGTVRLWDPQTGTAQTIITHEYAVNCLAVFPDGRVVSCCARTVRLWDPQTGAAETIITREDWVNLLVVLSDGRVVVSGGTHTVRLWDPQTGTAETIISHELGGDCLAVLPNGRVVLGSFDRTVRLWDPQTGTAETIITHEDGVSCLAVLPDGRVVSGLWDGTVRLWNPQTGTVETIITHKDRVDCLAVFPDGRVVSANSGCNDAAVRLWDPHTGAVQTIKTREDRVSRLSVCPDGRVVSGCYDGTVRLWDPQTGTTETIITHERLVSCLAVFPDGRVVSGSSDGTVRLWNPQTGTAKTIITHDGPVDRLVVLPDGRVVSEGWTVRLWDPQTGTSETIITREGWVHCLAVLPDGRVALGGTHAVQLWDQETRMVETIITHEYSELGVKCLAALPDGRVVSGSWEGPVRLWDPQTGTTETIITFKYGVNCLAVLPDGRVVSGYCDGTVRLWNPKTGAAETIITHEDRVDLLAVLPDGRVVSGGARTVRLWDPQTGAAGTIFTREGSVNCLAVLPDGRVVSGGATVRLWDPQAGTHETIITHEDGESCLAVFPDGRVVSGSRDGTVRLWNPQTGTVETIITHEKHELYSSRLCCVAVLPDGRVVSGGARTVRLWDPQTGTAETIITHEDRVDCLAVLPDGRVVSSGVGTIRLWDPQTGAAETTIKHNSWAHCLAVLPDGRIVSGSQDNTVRLWNPQTGTTETIITHETHKFSLDFVAFLAVLPDGCVVSGSHDHSVRLWDPQTGIIKTIITPDYRVNCLAVLPDGCVATGGEDYTVRLWDRASRTSGVIYHTGSNVVCLAHSADSSRIYAGLANGEVLFLQVEPRAEQQRS